MSVRIEPTIQDFYVFKVDKETFEQIGIIEKYKDCSWQKKFLGAGDVEIWTPITSYNLSLLKRGNIVWDGKESAMMIDKIKVIRDNSTGEKQLYTKGRTLEKLLCDRVVSGTYQATNKIPSNIIYEIVEQNLVNPTKEQRKIPWLVLSNNDITGETPVSKQISNKQIDEAIEDFCSENDLGYKIRFLPKERKMEFKVFKSVDRSIDTTLLNVDKILFSSDEDSIISFTYEENDEAYKNVAIVLGEDVGEERKKVIVGDDNISGLERKELAVDARDLQSEYYDDEGTEKTLSEEEYIETLKTRGKEKLEDYFLIQNFDSEIDVNSKQLIYGKDYFLGDKITIEDKSIDKRVNVYISEQEENWSGDGGYKLNIMFGFSQVSLSQKIKSIID